jgi:pyridoxal phosphate enzyme (YggS family)
MLQQILSQVHQHHARLVAVSKTHPVEKILKIYQDGQRIFGENRPQEMVDKQQLLPADIQWHMIGHLQTNKVKYIAPFVAMIHSVDSLKLLQEIDRQAQKNHRIIDCLLQFHIAREETKFGLDEQEAIELLESPEYTGLKHIRLCGVMGMATFTDDQQQVRQEFRQLKNIFVSLKGRFFAVDDYFREISMGMSGDWEMALEEGSTLVRIGSLIFGER